MEKIIEKVKEGNELSGSDNWSGCSLCAQFPVMWVPSQRPPLPWLLPRKLSSCIRILKSTFLAYFFHSFWSQHFFFSGPKCRTAKEPLLLFTANSFVTWFVSHILSHQKEVSLTQKQPIHSDVGRNQLWHRPSRGSKNETASRTLPPLGFPLQWTWVNVASKELCYFLHGAWGTQNVTKRGMITRQYPCSLLKW